VMSDTILNVLIVDDDALLRMSLLQTLTHAGFKVRSVDGGHAALSEIARETPDLLLSDLNMPGLSGFELLSVVRRRFPEVHVIAMSGAYFGSGVPPGVLADAFYEKGRGVGSLMQMVSEVAGSDLHLGASENRDSADS
jgi:DNA-binding NarL/FixJ family response regulator